MLIAVIVGFVCFLVGYLLCAALSVASDADDDMDAYLDQLELDREAFLDALEVIDANNRVTLSEPNPSATANRG